LGYLQVRYYTTSHGESHIDGDFDIIEKKVKASELNTDGDLHEWGYNPKPAATTSSSLPWNMSSKGEGDFYIQRVGPNAGKVSKTRNGPSDIAFSTDQEVLLPDYAYYAVMNLEKQLQSRAHGTAQQAINQKDVDEILTDFFQNQSKGVSAAIPIGTLGLTEESMTESMLGTQNVSDAFMHATENISPENITTREQGLIGLEDMTNEELDEYIKGLLGNIR